jgi:hypothetical protein
MSMVIDMNDEKLKTLEQIKEFMAGTEGVGFTHQPDRDTRYQHIAEVLCRLRYYALGKSDRGLVLRYLKRTTGYSRQQVTRLVRRYLDTGELKKRYKPPVNGFTRKYTSDSPNHGPGIPTTMAWRKPKTARSSGNTWAIPISRSILPRR